MRTDELAVVRRRMRAQRLAAAPFASPAEAWGRDEAQEYAERGSVMGSERTSADVEAAFDRGEILRTHVLRPTWIRRGGRHPLAARAVGAARARAQPLHVPPDRARRGDAGARLRARVTPSRGRARAAGGRAPASRARELAHLARGPATVRDFTAWSSLTVADARAGPALAADELERIEHHGTTWYVGPDARRRLRRVPDPDVRRADDRLPRSAGRGCRAVAGAARAAGGDRRAHGGSWKRTLGRREVVLDVILFAPLDAARTAALEAAAQRFGRFLALPATVRTSAL